MGGEGAGVQGKEWGGQGIKSNILLSNLLYHPYSYKSSPFSG